ncbi:hypothetical protein V2G26_003918 [Clonostachys chloroleuca]
MIAGYDVSNVANLQPSIYRAFGNIELLPWVSAAFTLGHAGVTPLLRSLMNLGDLKWFQAATMIIFITGSAVAGAASSVQALIIGRVLLGIGSSGAYLSILVYNVILAKPAEHSRLNSLIGAGFAVGLILGPVVGGAFAQNQNTTWRWAFYINIPVTAIAMALNIMLYPTVALAPSESLLEGLRRIDGIGATLHVATLVAFDVACLFSGTVWAWASGSIAAWVIFATLLVLYCLQQYFCWFTNPEQRILPLRVLSNRIGLLVSIATACAAVGYSITIYYIPLFLVFTRGDGPVQAAVHTLPFICVYIATAVIAGSLFPVIRRYAIFYFISGLFLVAGSGAILFIDQTSPLSRLMGITALIGAALGLSFQTGATVLTRALPTGLRIDSAVIISLTQNASITTSLAIAGCIFQNVGRQHLESAIGKFGFSAADINQALAGLESPVWAAGSSEASRLAVAAVTTILIQLFYISLAAGCLLLVCACLMKWEALNSVNPDNQDDHSKGLHPAA